MVVVVLLLLLRLLLLLLLAAAAFAAAAAAAFAATLLLSHLLDCLYFLGATKHSLSARSPVIIPAGARMLLPTYRPAGWRLQS